MKLLKQLATPFLSRLLSSSVASKVMAARTLDADGQMLERWIRPRAGADNRPDLLNVKLNTIKTSKLAEHVYAISLNRPHKLNAFTIEMFNELEYAFQLVEEQADARCIVFDSGDSKSFCSGMQLDVFANMQTLLNREKCPGRKAEHISKFVKKMQNVYELPTKCSIPVIASVKGHCIGAGIDVITACDLRVCTKDTKFSVKEIDLSIVADLGTLQRLPKLISSQRARELAYTGRTFTGVEAENYGFVLDAVENSELDARVLELAVQIASKSPLTIRGVKKTMNYQVDHSEQDGLDQVAAHNAASIMSDDLMVASAAMMSKTKPVFRT
jgi:enoyl-CoA hydratase